MARLAGDGPLKPRDVFLTWKREAARDRLRSCAAVLAGHGFMTAAEYDRVRARIDEWERVHLNVTRKGREVRRRGR